jgi:hypothetical protein
MKVKNINKVLTTNGNTSDIINSVMWAYDNENDPQIKEFAGQFVGVLDEDTFRNIWNFLRTKIKYKADSEGSSGEMIRTPARLIVDGTGDCKSYSLFTAVCLRWLGIPLVFRFVSYGTKQEATHVYVVAKSRQSNKEIVIDAVANVQAGLPFGYELKYTYKCDMANSGTKISYLAGLPDYNRKSKIGAINADRFKVWIGDENEADITPGKHYLYAWLDLHIEMYNISKTVKDQLYNLNQLDIIASFIHAYNVVDGDTEQFKNIAFVICALVADGRFNSNELNVDARYENLNDLYTIIEGNYNNGFSLKSYDKTLYDIILKEVLPYNEKKNNVSGIHGGETEFVSKLKESGIYYIYMFVSASDLAAMPDVVRTKLQKQQKTFNWVASVNTYQKESAMQNSIRSGIIARTGKTPEQIIAELKSGKKQVESIGFVVPATLITIATVISIITGLIAIINFIFSAKAAVAQPSTAEVNAGVFDPNTDFSKPGTNSGTGATILSSYALPVLLGGAAVFAIFKSKK